MALAPPCVIVPSVHYSEQFSPQLVPGCPATQGYSFFCGCEFACVCARLTYKEMDTNEGLTHTHRHTYTHTGLSVSLPEAVFHNHIKDCSWSIKCVNFKFYALKKVFNRYLFSALYVCMSWVLCKAVLWESVLVPSEVLLMLREFSDHVLA